MAIIRSREELLPVTCAVLSEADRQTFFSTLAKHGSGKTDRIARLLNIPVSVVEDWIAGRMNIPYHFLQRLAHEFSLDLPPVRELRRETQPVTALATAAPAHTATKGRAGREAPKEESAGERAPRTRRKRGSGEKPARGGAEKRGAAKIPLKKPKLSEELAYWIGTLLSGAARLDAALIFSADRAMGQNFADTWARRTRELFGGAVRVSSCEEGKRKEAAFAPPDIEALLKNVGLVQGKNGPPVPRWIWSNSAWKTACVKGLLDTGGRFHKAPAIVLSGLPEHLARSAQKLLEACELSSVLEPDGAVSLTGAENVERYFQKVSTNNLKLFDQLKAFFRRAPAPPCEGGPLEPSETTSESEVRDAPGDESAAASEAHPETRPESEEPKAAAEPSRAKRPRRSPRPRRTVYRGRPGSH